VKVLQIPFTFYPDPVGGTEVYVEALTRHLHRFGVEPTIAAPGSHDDAYEYQGIRVCRYGLSIKPDDLRELYGEGDPLAASSFDRILAAEQPDLLHLHAFTRGVSLRLVRAAKARRIPVVFTYHTPTTTCQRGTMMRRGTEYCEGLMEWRTCARCTLEGLFNRSGNLECHNRSGVRTAAARALAYFVGSAPPALGIGLSRLNLQGAQWTALRMTELIQLRHATVRSFLAEVDHIIAVCQWVRDVLVRNGVPPEKITLCRQGVAQEPEGAPRRLERLKISAERPLQIAFFGRFDPTKGVEILIHAVRSLPIARLRLAIYGVAQDEAGKRYELKVRRSAGGDGRIEFHPPVRNTEIVSTLRNYDLLAVPSQWLETGPLVVLEAFAAGIPVIGSQLGGITELIRDGFDGILVEPASTRAWTEALRRLSEDPDIVVRLRKNVLPPKSMYTVAKEMAELYEAVLSHSAIYCSDAGSGKPLFGRM